MALQLRREWRAHVLLPELRHSKQPSQFVGGIKLEINFGYGQLSAWIETIRLYFISGVRGEPLIGDYSV